MSDLASYALTWLYKLSLLFVCSFVMNADSDSRDSGSNKRFSYCNSSFKYKLSTLALLC